jgi:ERCC4-related helicase
MPRISYAPLEELRALIDAFNSYLIDELYVNKMTREGMNFTGIEAVILLQLDSGSSDNGLSFLQKSGRGMRADSPEIHIFVAVDTHDEKYLERALQFVDKKYIKKYEIQTNN